MKLMTKEIEALFKMIGKQEGSRNPIVVAHFFNPDRPGNWWATELYYIIKKEPVSESVESEVAEIDTEINGIVVDMVFFGFVSYGDFYSKWDYFVLSVLESIKCPSVVREFHFTPRAILYDMGSLCLWGEEGRVAVDNFLAKVEFPPLIGD